MAHADGLAMWKTQFGVRVRRSIESNHERAVARVRDDYDAVGTHRGRALGHRWRTWLGTHLCWRRSLLRYGAGCARPLTLICQRITEPTLTGGPILGKRVITRGILVVTLAFHARIIPVKRPALTDRGFYAQSDAKAARLC